ncbi:MAG: hypothetical protein EGQ00_09940 [Parabacteroides johnsonii]|nr:hypothetical protein [Parabacteroides johnsonii]
MPYYSLISGCDYVIAGGDYIISGVNYIITAGDYRIIVEKAENLSIGRQVISDIPAQIRKT